MKKTLIVIFVIFILLFGCENKNQIELQILDVRFSDEKIEVTINNLTEINVLNYGVVIKTNYLNDINELNIDNYDIKYETDVPINNKFVICFIPDEKVYNKDLYLRPFIKYIDKRNNDKIIYAYNYQKINIYELAKVSNDGLARKVVATVEKKVIKVIDIKIDTSKYIVTSLTNFYEAKLVTDYNKIKIIITINSDLFIDKNLVLKINNSIIDEKEYSIESYLLIYEFDDPNWTKPY